MRKLKNYKPTRFMEKTSRYDADAADYAVMFIESLCHTKGTWARQPFELIDWQEQIIRDIFGVLKPNGYRQFNTAYIEIPKKQGKSELAAAVALLLTCGDGEERAEVYGCAADRQQASIVFNVAADMVRMCPALSKRVKILDSQKRLIYQPTGSIYQVLSADVGNKHGFNTHGVVFDELHTQPNRKLFDVMTKGSGDARMQPLYFLITTAGNDTKSICYEIHQKAKDIIEGRKIDHTFYPVIYGAEESDDWTDPKVWKKANPSLGITVGIDKVKDACESAKQNPGEENSFRQLRLNQWVKQAVRWMPMDKWDKCEFAVSEDDLEGRVCYGGLDLSSTTDITAFVDNVNHTKLIQQIWHMGIRDKKLLCIIREMLKAPIVMPNGTVEHPTKGTPQGGILSPLLSNIVLNELDWWIDSQWENMPTKYEYSCEVRPNGTINKTAIYGAFKNTTKLKEVHIVRYADDFKLFCRKRSDAEKVFIAVKLWLQDRLKLEISEEKSKIVNLKRHYSEFLGFEMKAVRKRKRYVVKSHMTEKAISKEKTALIEQVKQIAHVQDRDDEAREITLYNSMVFGIHNYYRYATMIATDCEQIHRAVSTVMKNRLYGRLTKKGQINEVYIRKNYGDSKQIRFISSKTVAPVGYIQTKTPLFKKKKVCKYTPEGRAEIHKNLGINTSIMLALMRIKEPRRSVEYMDNRISLYAAQYGRCAVTGKELGLDEIHCHHKQPLSMGGTDKYMNLVIVHRDIHRLIHATDPNTIAMYLNLFQLDKKALAKLNALRVLTGQPEI